jgi:hypothetical protein
VTRAATAGFGTSVALSGSTALVGAPGHASSAGAAYVFTGTGASWSQQAELTASDATANAKFGLAVAVSGSTATVGAPGKHLKTGKAYVFVNA